ncbi:E3 ubiquitin-protein ligase RNF31 [Microtus ochrogaster]|uniref:E3 ubiquitin-protein ligase RNF31 n=1 Tax=Microtus ochrogaster TaxID=79684 RepID=A0A8J6GEA2_MICOH|nr:E3 ubiquitin-protein ligase RNF31 [Microtus ochrogaster]
MPGEEERAFLAAREELASALRRDSAQVFPLEQLKPFLATSLPPAARYLQLDAGRLVRCNAHGETRNYLNTLSTALNILEKYGRNLLSPQRPRYWRSVKFNNPVFRSTVDAVQGGRDVLRLYGYTEERPDGLSFPEGQEEPDEYQVAIVTLEVLLLRTELSLLLQNKHPRQNALDELLRDNVEDDSLVRRLLAVYTLPSWGRAELALSLLQETPRNYELLDVVEAVRHSHDRAFLRRLLAQECAVCGWALPRNRVSPFLLYLDSAPAGLPPHPRWPCLLLLSLHH